MTLNKAILIGRLTADPELRTTTNGITVASFTVAINRLYKNQNGEQEADFIRCVAFRKVAKNIGRYVHKGSKIAVEGSIQTRTYDGQDGTKRYVTEVICSSVEFLDSRNTNQNDDYSQPGYQTPQTQTNADDSFFDANVKVDITEDDLPF